MLDDLLQNLRSACSKFRSIRNVRVWGRQREDNQTETDDKDNSSDTLFISTKYFSNSHETNQEWWHRKILGLLVKRINQRNETILYLYLYSSAKLTRNITSKYHTTCDTLSLVCGFLSVRVRLNQPGGCVSIILSKLEFLLIYFKSWHFNCWSISIINSDHLIVKSITQSSNHLEK